MKRTIHSSSAKSRSAFETLESRRMLSAPGDLDPTFGTGGKLRVELGFDRSTPLDFAVANGGRMIFAGTQNGAFGVVRLLPNGERDTRFGDGGLVRTSFGVGDDVPARVLLDGNGKIVVAGTLRRDGARDTFIVARYNHDGSLDRSFDRDGKATVTFGGEASLADMTLQPDGKIVLFGESREPDFLDRDEDDFALARLNPDGSLDRTLDGDGKLSTDFGGASVFARSVLVQPDGKILVGGSKIYRHGSRVSVKFDSSWDPGFILARYHPNGKLDKSFDRDGKLSFHPVTAALENMAIQPDGKIVAVGGFARGLVARFNPNGSLDESFNQGTGHIVSSSEARRVMITPGNKIVLVTTQDGDFAIQRLNSGGLPDRSFGRDGKLTTDFGEGVWARSAIASGGQLWVAGTRGSETVVARYQEFAPTVTITAVQPDTNEGGSAEFEFRRDTVADVPTRVYYAVGGTAQSGRDYTGLPQSNGSALVDPARPGPGARLVTIPAGNRSVRLRIHAVDDSIPEPRETATITLLERPEYQIGDTGSATVGIRDNDVLRVNFQPAGAAIPARFKSDTGRVFGNRGHGLHYGWDADNTAQTRDRDLLSDQRFDTLTHLQKDGADRKWELALTNGSYRVRIGASDPAHDDGHWRIDAEGVLAIDHIPANGTLKADKTVRVNVTDGRLTIRSAEGAINNKISFIEIRSSDFVVAPIRPPAPIGRISIPTGPTTASGGSALGSGSSGLKPIAPIGNLVFSQQRIGLEELLR